jgi:3-oxoadipate enol-lactonase
MENKRDYSSGFAPVYHGNLYYETVGKGTPILLIHAGVADCTMWDQHMEAFCQHYQVIRYDTRGYGRSHSETTEFSNLQDILDLFSHLEIEKAVLIGISRGGQIAIDFTLEHPDRVPALVAVAAGISGYEYHPSDSPQERHEMDIFSHMDELWEKKAWEELADLGTFVWADGPSQPKGRADHKIRDYVREKILASLTREDGEARPIPLNPPAINRLGEITQPTLVLIGEYDTCATHAAADELQCHIPLSRKVGIPGVAHMIPLEQPSRFNEVVLGFLQEVV